MFRKGCPAGDFCKRNQSHSLCERTATTQDKNAADQAGDVAASRPGSIHETDGVAKSSVRDPPGQSTIHVTYGDHRRETYRVATFSKFPKEYPVNTLELACSGFYWTGYKDMVRCFCCGMSVENWMAGDLESDPKWHTRDCAMAQRLNCGNISSFYSERKSVFQQIYSVCRKPTVAASIPKTCAHQLQTQCYTGGNHDIPVADALYPAGLTLGARGGHSPLWKPRMLGEIHSQEQRQLIESLDLRKEGDRRKTFRLWPSYPAPELAMRLAEEGFFYLGNLDRTQCFSCCGVLKNWSKNDSPRNEHRKHFPNCDIVQEIENRNVPLSPETRRRLDDEERHRISSLQSLSPREPDDPPPGEKRRLESLYPCRNPMNPQMASEEQRISSFRQAWPKPHLKCTMQQIAKAGFFFLGQGDRTKCYYCNGGLQNWEENDEPWTEHAKWFPQCEFILRTKGPRFVHNQVQQHPNLNRPQIRNPVSYEVPDLREESSQISTGSSLAAAAAPAQIGLGVNELTHAEARRRNLCLSCRTLPADRLCQPCRHVSICSSCASSAQNCPFCRSRIDRTLQARR